MVNHVIFNKLLTYCCKELDIKRKTEHWSLKWYSDVMFIVDDRYKKINQYIPEAVRERKMRLIKKEDDLIRKMRKDLISEMEVLPIFVQRLLDDYGESGFEMIGY